MSEIDLTPLRQQLEDNTKRITGQLSAASGQVDSMWSRMRNNTRDDLTDFEKYARSGEAPSDIRRVQAKVDRGEVTWTQVFTGETDDRDSASILSRITKLAVEIEPVTHRAVELHSNGGLSGGQAVQQAHEDLQSKPDGEGSR